MQTAGQSTAPPGGHDWVRTLPGGVEAVVGAHGVVAEELPSVGAVRSGI